MHILQIFAIALLVTLGSSSNSKIEKSLQNSLSTKGRANIVVNFQEGTANIAQQLEKRFLAKRSIITRSQRANTLYHALKAHSDNSQAEINSLLVKRGISYNSYWITNQIFIKGADEALVKELEKVENVSEITEEETFHIADFEAGPIEDKSRRDSPSPRIEWHLERMGVPQIWSRGSSGYGTVIGNIDTGVRATHESIVSKWVGHAGLGWYDPEFKTFTPSDAYNHGTHTMGTLVGDFGIGIAPNATWIACKGYRDDGSSTAENFIACGQYMLCPVDYQGNNIDCTKGADIVSNSWGFWGGTTVFNPVLNSWIAAGMLASFSAGNTGPSCVSNYSPADQPRAISVGAVTNTDALASFSSTGPSPYGDIKPDISAPGSGIYSASSSSDISYMSASGTSMSCPNLTGILALLLGGNRNLGHDKALEILTRTAVRNLPTTGRVCGGLSDREFPNNHFGHGRVDGLAAYINVNTTLNIF